MLMMYYQYLVLCSGCALDLIRSVFPLPKGVRLGGVALSNFRSQTVGEGVELPFRET
jgi:hypothetical protein